VDFGTVLLRIGLATLLSGALGLERELKGQAAGLRTHMLVAVGACLFTLVGAYGFADINVPSEIARADVTRIASQVVVGIGFLGGGAILRQGRSVSGLTTAANLWVSAAIGLAVAAGSYFAATLVTAIVLAVLHGLKPLERWLARQRRRRRERLEPHERVDVLHEARDRH
jgi:putative Mg2+ transporter-C (MgtC) family protein